MSDKFLLPRDWIGLLESHLEAQRKTWTYVIEKLGKSGKHFKTILTLSDVNVCSCTYFAVAGIIRVSVCDCRKIEAYLAHLENQRKTNGMSMTEVAKRCDELRRTFDTRRCRTPRRTGYATYWRALASHDKSIPRLLTVALLTAVILEDYPELEGYY